MGVIFYYDIFCFFFRSRHTFCCAPINRKFPLLTSSFLKFARQFSKGEVVTFDWLCHQLGWPFSPPHTILDLVHLEAVHDVFDAYLWLSYRFSDMFPDQELVRTVQGELDIVIEEGVANIVQLLKNSEGGAVSRAMQYSDEEIFEAKSKERSHLKRWVHNSDKVIIRACMSAP